MLNVKDLPEYTNKINAAIDDAMANNGTQDSTGTLVKENSASQKDGVKMKRATS